jgi:hypothetical protein
LSGAWVTNKKNIYKLTPGGELKAKAAIVQFRFPPKLFKTIHPDSNLFHGNGFFSNFFFTFWCFSEKKMFTSFFHERCVSKRTVPKKALKK